MRLDEKKVVLAASVFAVAGIALLFFMSETPKIASVAEALVAQENTLVEIRGYAANVTSEKILALRAALHIGEKQWHPISAAVG